MSTQRQDQHWNAGVTEAQQLNTGGLDKRQASSPNQLKWKFLGRSYQAFISVFTVITNLQIFITLL